jgi:hypothetical protein
MRSSPGAEFLPDGWRRRLSVLPKLQLGVELFHQTADGSGIPATTSIGLGARYNINDSYHLQGYIRRGIGNTNETDQYSWYAAVFFTF